MKKLLAPFGLACSMFLCAAAPLPHPLSLQMIGPSISQPISSPAMHVLGQLEPAPVPDATLGVPNGLIEPSKTHLAPMVFSTSARQYRGDGFTADSSEQVAEKRNFRPGGGFSLKMPLQ